MELARSSVWLTKCWKLSQILVRSERAAILSSVECLPSFSDSLTHNSIQNYTNPLFITSSSLVLYSGSNISLTILTYSKVVLQWFITSSLYMTSTCWSTAHTPLHIATKCEPTSEWRRKAYTERFNPPSSVDRNQWSAAAFKFLSSAKK